MDWWKRYASDKPYPKIIVQEKNLYYASLLQDDYAGYVSEFTALCQYLHHHYYFEEIDKELGKMVEGISIIEMQHMEILAELIIKLGGHPQYGGYISTNHHYWRDNFSADGNNICDRLLLDIKAEKDMINAYHQQIKIIKDPHVTEILERIILDERHHLALFEKVYGEFCYGQKV